MFTIPDIGSYYWWYFAIWIAGLGAAIAALRRYRGRLRPRIRMAGLVVVGVCAARLLLFDNPFTLQLYQYVLTVENIGWRQSSVLNLEIRQYRRDIDQAVLPNLAVGSSQVWAIFDQRASPPPEPVDVYAMAGMKPLDFVLNEDAIAALRPARVILYLSAFDMTGSPELFSLPLAPPQWRTIWPVYSRLRAAGLTTAEIAPSFRSYLVSQFVKEYRYSFVYRALIRQWFGAAPRPQPPAGARMTELSSYFDGEWLGYNFAFLEDFLAFCQAHGIDVLVLEGQINPSAMTPEIEVLNATVRERLLGYRAVYSRVRYVPIDDVYRFSSAEYFDMTHVIPDAARRYTTRLAPLLK